MGPREWIEAIAGRVQSDPEATARRLVGLAARLARIEGPLPVADQVELCERLAAIESAVRLWDALAAAVESTRPQIDAARRLLSAARNRSDAP
jgi:hypothetical protein